MTLIAFFAFVAMVSLDHANKVPEWLFLSGLMLVVLLCTSTLFFLTKRIYQFIQRCMTKE